MRGLKRVQPYVPFTGVTLMPKKKAILDASSAIILYKADLHTITADLYNLLMVPSVVDEVTQKNYPGAGAYQQLIAAHRITTAHSVEKVPQQKDSKRLTTLDPGEKDSIRMLLNGTGDFLITDDGDAAKFCRQTSLPFINALLIPTILTVIEPEKADHWHLCGNRVMTIGRYSEWVINYARNCSKNELSHFLP